VLIKDTATPVVVLNCKLGALSIMRSLGSLGVETHAVDADRDAPGMLSRYAQLKFYQDLDENNPGQLLDFMLEVGRKIGRTSILIPTSDESAVFVAEYRQALKEFFVFPKNPPDLVRQLMSKKGMYELARKLNVPTPLTRFPQNLEDVTAYAQEAVFPVMLKGILGNRLQQRTGKKMIIVNSAEELVSNYQVLEDPREPNLMLQECIPGDDDEVYIFNGYFDGDSQCLSPFTGHKIRQFPVHVGCASLGACVWNKEVAAITTDFMRAIGYRGILDIGYRLDPRDGLYKVLDINPRVGQAFRMFVSEDGLDVVRDLYLDLTGQARFPAVPREGRRWMIEDFDLISSYDYYREGCLTVTDWLTSFRGLQEGLWFNWKDPWPFLKMSGRLLRRLAVKALRRLGLSRRQTTLTAAQKAPGV
jgi:D-aspartate ligase